MHRLPSFFAGLLVGAGLMFGCLKYHVVRAHDGIHWIPKSAATLDDTYVDVRNFKVQDWDQHRALGVAILRSDKANLLQDSAARAMQSSVQDAFERLMPHELAE